MNYDEILDFLYKRKGSYGTGYKLDRVIALFDRLNIRNVPFKTIHITGTNGKGSTSAMLESIYRHTGYKTGLFTSPHLISVFERIQVNRQQISCEQFCQIFHKIYPVAEELENKNPEFRISFFEYITAIALLFFREQVVDVAVIEAGLGGRLDATNAIQNTTISIITTIAYDHENTLGSTLAQIAQEKAGILRPYSLCILGNNIRGDAYDAIVQTARHNHCEIFQVQSIGTLFSNDVATYQNYNAATAILAAKVLRQNAILPIKDEQISFGLKQFQWPGRWQKFSLGNRLLIFDGAHNEEGALALAQELKKLNKKVTLIYGSNTVERATKMLNILAPFCEKIELTASHHEHALSVNLLKNCIPKEHFFKSGDIELENINYFIHNAPASVLVVSGSLYLVGDVMRQSIIYHEND